MQRLRAGRRPARGRPRTTGWRPSIRSPPGSTTATPRCAGCTTGPNAARRRPPTRIAVGGDSAGGGLAAGAGPARARPRRGRRSRFQLLVYPMLDDRTALRPRTPGHRHHLCGPAQATCSAGPSYLGSRRADREARPYAAPSRREDLTRAAAGVGRRRRPRPLPRRGRAVRRTSPGRRCRMPAGRLVPACTTAAHHAGTDQPGATDNKDHPTTPFVVIVSPPEVCRRPRSRARCTRSGGGRCIGAQIAPRRGPVEPPRAG